MSRPLTGTQEKLLRDIPRSGLVHWERLAPLLHGIVAELDLTVGADAINEVQSTSHGAHIRLKPVPFP